MTKRHRWGEDPGADMVRTGKLIGQGIGKLGAISRVLLARAGSVLIYASVGAATDVEGQLSLEQLRALGFGP